ncbi:uncharacterized protein LOC113768781 isoform X2 [Coffea eugenioides]|uniref:uncharacterized protein LOC113768781 isoform X2 n=1 Tax=Coffea eugenioides TaxID=49369 RepID=UPI000F6127B4|nr:uncharacterized protein LOC113768781 isoform X2 [Coffea eugenioides]
MQSINFNITTDFNAVRKPTWPSRLGSRLGHCHGDFERRQRLNCRHDSDYSSRFCRIVACASESQSPGGSNPGSVSGSGSGPGSSQGSFLSPGQTYALLKQQMEVAAKSEDYEEAARLRDSLKTFEDQEPVLRLKRLLKEAIDNERFEVTCICMQLHIQDAARYHDELKEIAPHSLLNCSSDATTSGIRVQVRSVYIEGRSQPSKGLYFFAYRIRITNNSERPVQLLRRHWIITDANGRTEHVWGIGVIGEQPVILPNTGFEYSSACPLGTSSGRMEGDFEIKHVDKVGSRTFNVAISPFSLSTFEDGGYSF